MREEEIKNLVDRTSKRLTDNGRLLISYLYDTKYQQGWVTIYNSDKDNELLKEYQPFPEEFQGVVGLRFGDEKIHDSVLIS